MKVCSKTHTHTHRRIISAILWFLQTVSVEYKPAEENVRQHLFSISNIVIRVETSPSPVLWEQYNVSNILKQTANTDIVSYLFTPAEHQQSSAVITACEGTLRRGQDVTGHDAAEIKCRDVSTCVSHSVCVFSDKYALHELGSCSNAWCSNAKEPPHHHHYHHTHTRTHAYTQAHRPEGCGFFLSM